MFERFTDRARRVVVHAQDEARRLKHNYIGTEHILLGLIREGGGAAADVLGELDVGLAAVRQQVETIIGPGKREPQGHIPFTPRAKKVLELSLRESITLGDDDIGTEHILLGLLSEKDGVACQVLTKLGVSHDRVRQLVIQRTRATPGAEHQTPLIQRTHVTPLAEHQAPRAEREETGVPGFVSRLAGPWRSGSLDRIDARLTRIERKLGIDNPERPRALRQLDEKLIALRWRLEAAIDEGDFTQARELRAQERTLREERNLSEQEWRVTELAGTPVAQELTAARERLAAARAELARMALLLREYGIDPGEPPVETDEPPGDADEPPGDAAAPGD